MNVPTNFDYQLTQRSRGGILRFQVTGDIDAQAVRIAYWQEIVAIAKQRKARKILVLDRKKHQPATPNELLELAQIMRVHADSFDGVAIVEQTAYFLPALEHGEIHAREHGINLRIFNSEIEAERWLLYGINE